MTEYFVGCLILAAIWLFMLLLRRDLRKPMIWSGLFYVAVLSILFIPLLILSIGRPDYISITPGYWHPNTIFDLNRFTGGYGIEDGLYIFLTGGIAAFVYDYFFKKKIRRKKIYKRHFRAILIGALTAILVGLIDINFIYALIAFGLAGAISIWVERKDLIKNSIAGGSLYLLIYFLALSLFNFLFPYFLEQSYNLQNISGLLIAGIPLEELLFAFSFGMMWAPIYEYEHGFQDVDIRQ